MIILKIYIITVLLLLLAGSLQVNLEKKSKIYLYSILLPILIYLMLTW